MRLAGRVADVDAVRPRPRDDGQAAGALVAAVRGAGVAEQRVAHAPGGHGARQRGGRDELVALAVGEDQDRAPVASDQRPGLGRRADGDLVGRAGRVRAQEVRQRGDARRRHRPGAPRRLGAVAHGGHRRGQRERQDRAQRAAPATCARRGRARTASATPAPRQAATAGSTQAEVARAQARHGAAQREARDEPERRASSSPPRPDAAEPARTAERQRDGERRQRGDGLDADPPPRWAVAPRAARSGPGGVGRRAERGGVLARPRAPAAARFSHRAVGCGAARAGATSACAVGAAALAGQQPRDPVVDERGAPRRAVRRAQRPRPRMQRDDGHDHEPRQRAWPRRRPPAARARPAAAGARAGRRRPQQRRRGDGQQRLGELDLEREAEQHARPGQRPQAPAARGPRDHGGAAPRRARP